MNLSIEEIEIILKCLEEHSSCDVHAFYEKGYDRDKYNEESEKLRILNEKRSKIIWKIKTNQI